VQVANTQGRAVHGPVVAVGCEKTFAHEALECIIPGRLAGARGEEEGAREKAVSDVQARLVVQDDSERRMRAASSCRDALRPY